MRVLALFVPALFLVSVAAQAQPCIIATEACTGWITLVGGPARSMIYRTYSLDAKNEKITRALMVIHGTNRDADNYFPQRARGCQDKLAPNEVSYSCGGDSWRSGGVSGKNDKLTSFDFIDEILRKLASREAFPNLKAIVVAGHSAGGQFVTRYEMSNRVHETLGLPVTYAVANPSSYAYLDNTRPAGENAPPSGLSATAALPTITGLTGCKAARVTTPKRATIN